MNLVKIIKTNLTGFKQNEEAMYFRIIQYLNVLLNKNAEEINYYKEKLDKSLKANKNIQFRNKQLEETNYSLKNTFDKYLKYTVLKLNNQQLHEFYEIIDPEGWILYRIVKELTSANTNDLHYEDNMGYFETLNGFQLIKWLENITFAPTSYEIVEGTCYERTIFKDIDKTSNKYDDYLKEISIKLVEKLSTLLIDTEHINCELLNDGLMYLMYTLSN